MSDLTPKVLVYQHDAPMPAVQTIHSSIQQISSGNIRVSTWYDIAASPMAGQWCVRVDVYKDDVP